MVQKARAFVPHARSRPWQVVNPQEEGPVVTAGGDRRCCPVTSGSRRDATGSGQDGSEQEDDTYSRNLGRVISWRVTRVCEGIFGSVNIYRFISTAKKREVFRMFRDRERGRSCRGGIPRCDFPVPYPVPLQIRARSLLITTMAASQIPRAPPKLGRSG